MKHYYITYFEPAFDLEEEDNHCETIDVIREPYDTINPREELATRCCEFWLNKGFHPVGSYLRVYEESTELFDFTWDDVKNFKKFVLNAIEHDNNFLAQAIRMYQEEEKTKN